MKSALKSFVLITISVIFCTCVAWIYLRAQALNATLQTPIQHPFLQSQPPSQPFLIAYEGGNKERPENTLLAFDHAASLDPHMILWADIRQTRDGVLVAFREQDLSTTTDGKGWIGFTDYKDLSHFNAAAKYKDENGANPYLLTGAHIPTLKELLERYPNRFVLNFRDYQTGMDDRIIETIDQAKAGDRILIQSEQDGILKTLREKKPTWLFGTSQARVTQLKILASIGLEAMAPLKGDVYVTEVEINHNQVLTDAMIGELKRRKMPIFVGPVASVEQAKELLARGANGIITSQPSLFVNK